MSFLDRHISTVGNGREIHVNFDGGTYPADADPDGICHCDPQPDSSPIGECPKCHRLDARKAHHGST